MGGQQTRPLRPAGGAGGQDAVGPGQVGVHGVELAQVGPDGAGVPAGDRPGERPVAVAQRVVQRGRQQRRDEPLRGVDAGALQDVHAVAHQRDQVVRAVRQGRVVERADGLGHADRFGAHLDDEGLTDAPRGLLPDRSRDRDARTGQPGDVLGAAGEGHHRVQGEREHAVRRWRGRARRRPALPRCARRSVRGGSTRPPRDRGRGLARTSSGTASRTRSAAAAASSGGTSGTPGSSVLGAPHRCAGDPRGRDDPVPGGGQRGTHDRADPAGGDHADGEPGGPACTHRSHSSTLDSHRLHAHQATLIAAPRVDATIGMPRSTWLRHTIEAEWGSASWRAPVAPAGRRAPRATLRPGAPAGRR